MRPTDDSLHDLHLSEILTEVSPVYDKLQPWMIGRLIDFRVKGYRHATRHESGAIKDVNRHIAGRLRSYQERSIAMEDGTELKWTDIGGFSGDWGRDYNKVIIEILVVEDLRDVKLRRASLVDRALFRASSSVDDLAKIIAAMNQKTPRSSVPRGQRSGRRARLVKRSRH